MLYSNITTLKNKFFIIQEYKYTITNFTQTNTSEPSKSAFSIKVQPTIPSGYTVASYCLGQTWDDGFISQIVPPEYNSSTGLNQYVIMIKHNYLINNNTTFQFTFRLVCTKSDITTITTSTTTTKR